MATTETPNPAPGGKSAKTVVEEKNPGQNTGSVVTDSNK
jgi:hypothetical protein